MNPRKPRSAARQRKKRTRTGGAFIAGVLATKDPWRFELVAICLREQDEMFGLAKRYSPRQIDALERLFCNDCGREHRVVRYWEALSKGLIRRGRMPKLLEPPPERPQDFHVPLPWKPERVM